MCSYYIRTVICFISNLLFSCQLLTVPQCYWDKMRGSNLCEKVSTNLTNLYPHMILLFLKNLLSQSACLKAPQKVHHPLSRVSKYEEKKDLRLRSYPNLCRLEPSSYCSTLQPILWQILLLSVFAWLQTLQHVEKKKINKSRSLQTRTCLSRLFSLSFYKTTDW